LILIAKPFLTFWVKFYQFIEPPGINFRKGIETILFQAQWTVIVFFLFSLNVINLRAEQYWKGCMKRMYICEYIRKYLHVYLFFILYSIKDPFLCEYMTVDYAIYTHTVQ